MSQQSLVARRFGWLAGWVFAMAASGLSGFGICIGRFLRWNSWDALLNPVDLLADIARYVTGAAGHPRFFLPALLATLFFVAYMLLYALTRLPAVPQDPNKLSTAFPTPSRVT